VFFGGTIITIDDNQPYAEAVGIKGGKIVSVGLLDDVKQEMSSNCQYINLNGRTLLPGFIDCHLHPISMINHSIRPDVSNMKSLSELQEYLKMESIWFEEDEFIMAYNLNEEQFEEAILPNRWDLDKACPNHPLFVLRYDGHIGIANSNALQLAGITEQSIIPEGGELREDEEGKLTGVITEKALNLMFSVIPVPGDNEIDSAAAHVSSYLAERGLTSFHGVINGDNRFKSVQRDSDELSLYERTYRNILQDCNAYIETDFREKVLEIENIALRNSSSDAKFKIGGLKLYLDGSFGAKTAAMFEPFADAPDMCGFCVIEEEDIYDKMKLAHNKNFQIIIHAIGDKANRIAMDLYKRLLKEFPRGDHRHRIEHASMLTKDVLKDMAEYGIIASCQPPFLNSEYTWISKRIGEERCKYTYPMKSIVDNGVVLASGSDCPVEDPNPILGLHALVTRNGFVPEECLSVEEALKSYTINAAFAAFEENLKGSIEVGKFADLVILDLNPLDTPLNKIQEIKILETLIKGRTVFKMDE
jgi:predicted amidohydrolase YtcJ